MNEAICQGIAERKLLRFLYQNSTRIVEPYCYGRTRLGTELLRAFQISGVSRSGHPIGWRLFDAHKMSDLVILQETFSPYRGDYQPQDPKILVTFCRI